MQNGNIWQHTYQANHMTLQYHCQIENEDEFESCWFDACEDEDNAQEVVCQWLDVYAKKAEAANVGVGMWRRPDFCREQISVTYFSIVNGHV